MEKQESEQGVTTISSDSVASNATGSPTSRTGDAPSGDVGPEGLLLANWNRYEVLGWLGAGNMGTVYKARDPRSKRVVAIKFVQGLDPKRWMRFRREAIAQARIVHPNVCRVYEVDDIHGHPYIAMQLVEGAPLHEAAAQMSLHDKVATIRDVAMAIQEAHRLQIVHRDIKPANVMVECLADGRRVPIVMDFGLARDPTELGLTESGAVLGTPPYMAPEQARGDVDAVDRRTDIYGLGATLYELLTGRPPFAGASQTAVLSQVIHDEPVAPRRLVQGLRIDLEIITLKCLAKEPAQRYGSAQELADDLDRYLAGESILGRRPSLWHRLRRGARRHRSLVVLGTASLVGLVVIGALGARAWLISRTERARSAQRTILAERLGRDAKDIELFMRSAYQLPLRDMRPMRARVRARMQGIAETQHDLGVLGDAVIHDALGRGHLALHEWQRAADELARAAEVGPADLPELHAARGRALGELYHRALEEARRSGDRSWLARRQQELERQYLAPALSELGMSRGAGDNAEYLRALIALYRGDVITAERTALAAVTNAPWLFEPYKVAGDAAYSAAITAFDHGDYETARAGLEHAGSLYTRASEVARSDASLYEAAAQAALQRAEIDVRQDHSPRSALEHARDMIDKALQADPDDAPAHTTRAYVLLRWLRTPALRGIEDERVLHERVEQSARRAVDLDPDEAGSWDALGTAHVFRGNYESYHGGDGGPWWQLALDDYRTALKIRPDDPWANNDAGMAHRWIGASLDQVGQDPMPAYRAALGAYQRAVQLDPDYVFAWANQADLYAEIAEHQSSRRSDPHMAADDARHAGEQCRKIDPRYGKVLDSMAQGQLALARYLLDTGGDPREALHTARGFLDDAEQLRADNPPTWFHRLVAARIAGELDQRDGGDPRQALARGRLASNKLLQLRADSADMRVEAARLDLAEARWLARRGGGATGLLASAAAHATKAKELDRRFAEVYLVAAEICLERARGSRSRAALIRCRADVDAALHINPRLVKAQRLRDELDRLLQK